MKAFPSTTPSSISDSSFSLGPPILMGVSSSSEKSPVLTENVNPMYVYVNGVGWLVVC